MTEQWRDIPAAPGYQVSSDGRVRSVDRIVRGKLYQGKVLSTTRNQSGHLKLPLRVSPGATRMFYIHSLVAEQFIGLRPDGKEVAHNDGDPTNNVASNLRYATPAENQADRQMHGTALSRSNHPAAILSDEQVATIRAKLGHGIPQRILAAEYRVSRTTISAISTGRSWR